MIRTIIAALALPLMLAGPATARPLELVEAGCSQSEHGPMTIRQELTDGDSFVLILQAPDGREIFDNAGSLGTNLPGWAYQSRKPGTKLDIMRGASTPIDTSAVTPKNEYFTVFRDHAFWACKVDRTTLLPPDEPWRN